MKTKLSHQTLVFIISFSTVVKLFADGRDPADNNASSATLVTVAPNATQQIADSTVLHSLGPGFLDVADWYQMNLTVKNGTSSLTDYTYNFVFVDPTTLARLSPDPVDPPSHPHLYIQSPSGGAVTDFPPTIGDHIGSGGFTFKASFTGIYKVEVVPFANPPSSFFNYKLAFSIVADPADPADNVPSGATALAPPTVAVQKTPLHTLSVLGPSPDYYDWFSVSLTKVGGNTTTYNFNCSANVTSGDPYIELFPPGNTTTPVVKNDDSGGNKAFNLNFTVDGSTGAPEGVYYVRIRAAPSPKAQTAATQNVGYYLQYSQGAVSGGGGGAVSGIDNKPLVAFPVAVTAISAVTTVQGTAVFFPPATGIDTVWYRTRFLTNPWTRWILATGTDNWSFTMDTSRNGSYSVQAYAIDDNGVPGPYSATSFLRR